MGNMDATIRVPIHIINPYSENTIVQVDVSHLNKRIEVVIPNNIQPGHIIRLKGLGYGGIGDLLIEISSITLGSSDNTTKQTERKKDMIIWFSGKANIGWKMNYVKWEVRGGDVYQLQKEK